MKASKMKRKHVKAGERQKTFNTNVVVLALLEVCLACRAMP